MRVFRLCQRLFAICFLDKIFHFSESYWIWFPLSAVPENLDLVCSRIHPRKHSMQVIMHDRGHHTMRKHTRSSITYLQIGIAGTSCFVQDGGTNKIDSGAEFLLSSCSQGPWKSTVWKTWHGMPFLWEGIDEGSGLVFQIFVGTPQEGSVGRLFIASMERGALGNCV